MASEKRHRHAVVTLRKLNYPLRRTRRRHREEQGMSAYIEAAVLRLLYETGHGWTAVTAAEAFYGRDADEAHRQALQKAFVKLREQGLVRWRGRRYCAVDLWESEEEPCHEV